MVCKRIVSRPSLEREQPLLYLHTIELRRCPAERLGMREFLVGIGARLNQNQRPLVDRSACRIWEISTFNVRRSCDGINLGESLCWSQCDRSPKTCG